MNNTFDKICSRYAYASISFVFVFLFSVLSSCERQQNNDDKPVVELIVDSTNTSNGDTVAVGHALNFELIAHGNSAPITNIVVKKKTLDGFEKTMMDTGVYSKFISLKLRFYQGVEEEAIWSFNIQDRNRMTAKKEIVIYKDPNSQFGGIMEFEKITMGYQNNTDYGQFLVPSTGKVYFIDSATIVQDQVNILTYFIIDDNTPSPVFSSPGEYDNFSTEASVFYPNIISWTKRNYTKWDISVDDAPISAAEFDNCHNDSLIILSYNDVWGKKKFKWANTGTVIPFMTNGGKKGLIKVLNAELENNGKIEFSMKIQL
jgi:hypothetical protein